MPYQKYQPNDIQEILANENSITTKVFSHLLDMGIDEYSVQKILGSDEVRKKSFWKGLNLEDVPHFDRFYYENGNQLWLSQRISNISDFVINEVGLGIKKQSIRQQIRQHILLNEIFAEFYYDSQFYGKIESVNFNHQLSFTYTTPLKKEDGVQTHSLQFIDAEQMISGNVKINPNIKTIVVANAEKYLSDPFQMPLLYSMAQELVKSDFVFAFCMDANGNSVYLLSKNGIAQTNVLTMLSPSYANRMVPSEEESRFKSSLDLLDSPTYRNERLEKYGINIELGIVQMSDDKMTRFIIDNIARNIVSHSIHVSKALKGSFQSYDGTLFDIDDLIKNNTYDELNNIAHNLKYINYVEMLSVMANKRKEAVD